MTGLVIKNTGSHYTVVTGDGTRVNCKIKGTFRLKGVRTTNPVAVGDEVTITDPQPDGSTFITAIAPRRNYIIRRASNLSKESHILASNIDQALLIASLYHPVTSTTFIDRFFATAEAYRIQAILVINKTDLLTSDTDRDLFDAVAYLYDSIGYTVIGTSAMTGEGIGKLRSVIAGKKTLVSGNSGVGKSSLINAILPGLDLRTGDISSSHDTGMHTTTFSEMFELPGGGYVIDTPGVKGFGTIDFSPNEVAHYFPEIFTTGQECRYGDCSHTHEPGCAVLRALEENRIAASRYNSYLSILSDAAPDKYRKPQ